MSITVTLMSFNTQHCADFRTGNINYDIMADAVRSCGADIVGLNEMRGAGTRADYEAQTEILADKLGMFSYFAKAIDVEGSNPYGNALLSRYPILEAAVKPIVNPDPMHCESRCLLCASLEVGGEPLRVCVTHFGLSAPEQEKAVECALENIRETRCVLMGDFNITPDNPMLAPLRSAMFDTASLFDAERLSFPSDAPVKKIDYLFTSRDIEVLQADIPALVASDHRPHTAQIRLA